MWYNCLAQSFTRLVNVVKLLDELRSFVHGRIEMLKNTFGLTDEHIFTFTVRLRTLVGCLKKCQSFCLYFLYIIMSEATQYRFINCFQGVLALSCILGFLGFLGFLLRGLNFLPLFCFFISGV